MSAEYILAGGNENVIYVREVSELSKITQEILWI